MASAELPPSLAAPRSSPRLPIELLAQIVSDPNMRDDSLAWLCLTSKSILAFARPELYRQISVDAYEAESISAYESHDGRWLLYSLAHYPHLARLVTRVNLTSTPPDEDNHGLHQYLVESFLRLCPHLTSFRTAYSTFEEAEDVIPALLQSTPANLTELEIDFLPGTVPLLARLPHLRHLILHVIHDPFEDEEVVPLPFKLESLRLSDGPPPTTLLPTPLLDELFRSSAQTLQALHLFLNLASQAAPYLHQLAALSHLQLAPSSRSFVLPDELLKALPKCAGLRSLRLDGSRWPSSEIARIAPLPQLTVFRLSGAIDEKAVLLLLSDRQWRSLRRIVLDDGRCDDGRAYVADKWDELGAEHGWSVECFRERMKFVFAR